MRDVTVSQKNRLILFGILIGLAVLIIIGAFAYHQFFHYQYYREQARNNQIRVQPLTPKRGLIYDRNMDVIADNRLSFTISVVPVESVEGVTIPRLAELLGTDSAAIEKRIKTNYVGQYIPAAVRRGLGMDVISILEEQARDYPGISYSVESVRRYKNDISAGTFIGYTGEVSPKELESEIYKDYRPGSLVGKKGIERRYDHRMRGWEGTRYVEVSARGQIIGKYRDKPEIPPRPGNDIVLTIDNDLQRFIVANFDSVKCCGAVVAMEPHNGGILALASFPEFDPNLFSGVIPPAVWDSINTDTTYPLFNRPLTGEYPPGSTAKLITAGAVLEENLVTPTFLLESCRGGMQFGNRFFRCWDPAGHGRTNVYEAIEQSCDVYFYQVGKMLGIDTWARYARQCGFDKVTGIDIPSEKKGVVADTEFFDRRDGKSKWSPNEALNLAIGQGAFSVTPLQLAQFYCGLANEGIVYRPHLIKEFVNADGSVEAFEPEVSFRLPFSTSTLEVLTQALDSVVQGDHGTARGRQNEFFRIAGKTGTAQNPHGENHAWFACYAPCDNPRIVVVVLVENAGHGSEEAAPLAGKILKYYLQPKHPPLVLNTVNPKLAGDSL